jgi:hypothetical protein
MSLNAIRLLVAAGAVILFGCSDDRTPVGQLDSGPPEASVDMAPLDQTPPDQMPPDQTQPDHAIPDQIVPDLLQPDALQPDLIPPDMTLPDLVQPDLVQPDLVQPDQLQPDQTQPDLLIPDLVPPDMTLPSCTDKVKNGTETDVDCGGTSCSGCDVGKVCAQHRDCMYQLCQNKLCTVTDSCKMLLSLNTAASTGVYKIKPAGGTQMVQVYCDMKTSGGGWTALLNPSTAGMTATTHPDLKASTKVLSGTQTCSAGTIPKEFSANGWNGYLSYACGNVTFSLILDWKNTLAAKDLMFIATLQGQATRKLTIDGVNAPYTGFSNAYMKCAFWNGPGKYTAPAQNMCWKTSLDVAPKVYLGKVGANLNITMTTGPACSPDCKHGAGMNIQKLFVR